jgi:hypothetical protein
LARDLTDPRGLAANGPAICGYWYQVGPVRAGDLLALLRPAPGPSR